MVSVLPKDTFQEYTPDVNIEMDFMVEDVKIVSYQVIKLPNIKINV